MSYKQRRQQYLKQKERERMREEPLPPMEAPEHDPYDFGLFQQPASNPQADELIRQQRRAVDWLQITQGLQYVESLRQRSEAQRHAMTTPPPSTLWQTQAILSPIFQELQYRELFQIHKAINGGVYLP